MGEGCPSVGEGWPNVGENWLGVGKRFSTRPRKGPQGYPKEVKSLLAHSLTMPGIRCMIIWCA